MKLIGLNPDTSKLTVEVDGVRYETKGRVVIINASRTGHANIKTKDYLLADGPLGQRPTLMQPIISLNQNQPNSILQATVFDGGVNVQGRNTPGMVSQLDIHYFVLSDGSTLALKTNDQLVRMPQAA